jgi:parvulin-like peptidyl-prolyl isomerase
VIAKAGDLFISEQEFVRRFELLPAFGRNRRSQIEKAKLELLYSIIAEKLLAQEAIARGLDADSVLQRGVTEVRKLLARDELYRREIANKVTVSEKEILQGAATAQRQLFLSYLFFEDEQEARFVRSRLRGANDFDQVQLDSSMQALRDTATLVWGEADPAIEDAAYRLRPSEISPVVAAGTGYYILKLTSEERSAIFTSLPPEALAERVRKKLRARKEKVRLDEYTREVLQDKVGYAVSRTLKALAMAVAEVSRSESKDSVVVMTADMMERVREQCSTLLLDTLAVIDTTVVPVTDFIDVLTLKGMKVRRDSPADIMRSLNGEIRVWVLQELMAREALRLNLDTLAEVQSRLEMWKQYFLAEEMKGIVRKGVRVSEAEVWSYMQSLDPAAPVPQVQLRELRTSSLEEMEEALAELQQGASFEEVVRRRSNDPEVREKGGVTRFFRITDRYPVGEIAAQMETGQRYGPLSVPGGYLFFELHARKTAPLVSDTSLASRLASARNEVLKLKQNRKLSIFLAQSGRDRGFLVYEDRVRAIKATPLPMMTFRILGFGGRMFEVPFVEREIDWLSIEPPEEKILP